MIGSIQTPQYAPQTHPDPKRIHFAGIPEDLRRINRWVLWKLEPRDGKITKIPYRVSGTGRASSTDYIDWSSFEAARKVYDLQSDRYDGIGFVLADEDDLICIDLDDKDGTDRLSEYTELAMRFNSWAEISYSGRGIHIWCRGKKPGDKCRRGDVELYETGRFIAVTGNTVPGTPSSIANAQEAINNLYQETFQAECKHHTPSQACDEYSDGEIIELATKENPKFSSLFRGDTGAYDNDDSRADAALCSILAWYTRDVFQIERIFRQSGLYREKWDRNDYRVRTISGALSKVTNQRERTRSPVKSVQQPAPEKKSGSSKAEKKPEETPKRKIPYFEKADRLYLTVLNPDETTSYAHLEGGEIVFSSVELDPSGFETVPPSLPVHQDQGTIIPIVGIPRSDLLAGSKALHPHDLYVRIRDHFYKYFDAPEIEYELFVYYALYSWFYPKCSTVPYLRFLGDTGKGKSRFLKVISDLCFYPIKASGASSVSGLMRFKERFQGTLLIDESDLKGDQTNNLIKYLNLGFEKGNHFILTDKNDVSNSHFFDPFSPKVIAMRQPFGDNATEGRCLSFSPDETIREDIPSELPGRYFEEVEHLRALIARFTLEHWQDISEHNMISLNGSGFEGRLKQMARPMSIILTLFPDGEERFRAYLESRQKEIKQTRSESWEGSMFNFVLQLANGDECLMSDPEFGRFYLGGRIQAVVPKMVADALHIKPAAVTRALKGIGFECEQRRVTVAAGNGTSSKNVRPLMIKNQQKWREIVQRYYANEDGEELPECPECLKGPEYRNKQIALFQAPEPQAPPVPPQEVEHPSQACEHRPEEISEAPQETPAQPVKESPRTYSEWLSYHGMPEATRPDDFKTILDKADMKGYVCFCKGCAEPQRTHPLYWDEQAPKYARKRICQHHKNEMSRLWEKDKEAGQ